MIKILISGNKKCYKIFHELINFISMPISLLKKEKYKFFKSQKYNILEDKIIKIKQELQSKTALLHYTNHEIRTIIHGISGISQFLTENWLLLDENNRQKYINSIYQNSLRMKSFMDELLYLLKTTSGKRIMNFTRIDLIEEVNRVIQQCTELYIINKDIKIVFEHTELGVAMINADQAMINQLLLNLFNNAIKYTEKGIITATIFATEDNRCWKFSISDEGIGIPDDELESIFELFVRSSRTPVNSIGTGIGLTICKEVIAAHNGVIVASNNNNVGANFSFIIKAF
jgi:two-component system sensor histidine kinase ChiS